VIGGAGVIGGADFRTSPRFQKLGRRHSSDLRSALKGWYWRVPASLSCSFPGGIALSASASRFGTLVVLLLALQIRLIRVTDKLRLGIVAGLPAGIALFYLVGKGLAFWRSCYGRQWQRLRLESASAFLS